MNVYGEDIDGNRFWLDENGKFHREDGPAITWADGHEEFWHNGQIILGG